MNFVQRPVGDPPERMFEERGTIPVSGFRLPDDPAGAQPERRPAANPVSGREGRKVAAPRAKKRSDRMRKSLAATRKVWDNTQDRLNKAEDRLSEVEAREANRQQREANRA